jgi:hypothetical protein
LFKHHIIEVQSKGIMPQLSLIGQRKQKKQSQPGQFVQEADFMSINLALSMNQGETLLTDTTSTITTLTNEMILNANYTPAISIQRSFDTNHLLISEEEMGYNYANSANNSHRNHDNHSNHNDNINDSQLDNLSSNILLSNDLLSNTHISNNTSNNMSKNYQYTNGNCSVSSTSSISSGVDANCSNASYYSWPISAQSTTQNVVEHLDSYLSVASNEKSATSNPNAIDCDYVNVQPTSAQTKYTSSLSNSSIEDTLEVQVRDLIDIINHSYDTHLMPIVDALKIEIGKNGYSGSSNKSCGNVANKYLMQHYQNFSNSIGNSSSSSVGYQNYALEPFSPLQQYTGQIIDCEFLEAMEYFRFYAKQFSNFIDKIPGE